MGLPRRRSPHALRSALPSRSVRWDRPPAAPTNTLAPFPNGGTTDPCCSLQPSPPLVWEEHCVGMIECTRDHRRIKGHLGFGRLRQDVMHRAIITVEGTNAVAIRRDVHIPDMGAGEGTRSVRIADEGHLRRPGAG